MLPNYLILCRALLLLPSVFPSTRVFSNELTLCIRWPKYWSFTFSINLSNSYSGLISFRIHSFDLLPVQGTQESSPTPQFKSIDSSPLSLFCGPTLTSIHDYWESHRFESTDICQQIMSLLFNMLSSFVIAFLPRTKRFLIARLQSPSAVILEPKKIVCRCFHCFSIYLPVREQWLRCTGATVRRYPTSKGREALANWWALEWRLCSP